MDMDHDSWSGQDLADGRIGIVNHLLEVVYETYVYVNPANVIDWCTACKSS